MPGHNEDYVEELANQYSLTPEQRDMLKEAIEEEKRHVDRRGDHNLTPETIRRIFEETFGYI